MIDHEGFKRCGLKPYSDDSELAVGIQSRALDEAVMIAHKWYPVPYSNLKLLNFVTFTVRTDSPRAAPTLHYTYRRLGGVRAPPLNLAGEANFL